MGILHSVHEGWRNMKSGGGVLFISAGQALVSLILLGIYEGFRVHFFASPAGSPESAPAAISTLSFRSPLDYVFYLSIVNNIAAIFGFAGVLTTQRELVQAFFAWNAVQMVLVFYLFVDVVADVKIRFKGEPIGLTSYENAAAAFLFICFVLSVGATIFALKAIEEIRGKQKEEFRRLSVLSDTLQYEVES